MNRKLTQSFKQAGFTLLELLVVITLLAVLATGALVAYEGIGENAQDTAAASALHSMENSLRNYRGVENKYPQQYDLLANVDANTTSGAVGNLLADETKKFFGQWAPTAANADTSTSVWYQVAKAMKAVGIEELQAVQGATTWDAGFVPNLALNESYPLTSANPGSELELWNDASDAILYDEDTLTNNGFASVALSIVPSSNGTSCTADSATLADTFDGITVGDNERLNLINDGLDDDDCALVIAVGIGKDVPGSTLGSRVAISQVATVGTNNVNPNKRYARAIALFHVATDEDDSGTIDADEVLAKARLIGVVDPEGRIVDQVIAAANAAN
jgi:prepilin-type N-terminal cleavage/methylation domain-containing protein